MNRNVESQVDIVDRSRPGRILLLGGLLMAVSWVADSVLDAVYQGESLGREIFAPDAHELSIRLLFLGAQLLFVCYIAFLLRKRESLETSLAAAVRRADLEKDKAEAILEVLGDAISIQDTDLKVLYQNRAHQALMGDRRGEYCYAAYQKQERACDGCHLVCSFADGLTHCRESRAETASGPGYFEIVSTPLRDSSGKIVAGIESVRDITERKQAEQRIVELNHQLEQKAAELVTLNQELETFSYSLSHDLKTPLASIYACGQLLADNCGEQLDDNGRYFVDTICHMSERMEALLNSMLVLSRVTHGDLRRERVDLSRLARDIFAELQLGAPGRVVDWEVVPDLVATGDQQLLASVLENLIGNAWKYTASAGSARIEFGAREEAGERVYFIRDNGVGFDMKDTGRLFRAFCRLHPEGEFAGTGVGLATVQHIVQRHGGRIWAEGAPGKGATFYFTL